MFSQSVKLRERQTVNTVSLPVIPHNIHPAHLGGQVSLLSAARRDAVLASGDQESHEAYTLVNQNDEWFAIYDKNLLGRGQAGDVKTAQHIESGDWVACKIVPQKDLRGMEASFSREMGLLYQSDQGQTFSFSYATPESKHKTPSSAQKDEWYQAEDYDDFNIRYFYGNDVKLHATLYKFVSGAMLHKVAWHDGCVNSLSRIDMMISLLCLLQRLHNKNVTHQGIHEDNLMIDVLNGDCHLIDYGRAQITIDEDHIKLRDIKYLLDTFNKFMLTSQWLRDNLQPLFNKVMASGTGESINDRYTALFSGLEKRKALLPEDELVQKVYVLDAKRKLPTNIDGKVIWLLDTVMNKNTDNYLQKRYKLQQRGAIVGDVVHQHPNHKRALYALKQTLQARYPHARIKLYDAASGKALRTVIKRHKVAASERSSLSL